MNSATHDPWRDEDLEPLRDDECPGHPAGEFDPMGVAFYCDGSCHNPSIEAPERVGPDVS